MVWLDFPLNLPRFLLANNTGEIGDICEAAANYPLPLTSPVFMPFLSLHVARYWSNADQQCMPQFDQTNNFSYQYTSTCGLLNVCPGGRPQALAATASNASLGATGFWAAALASSPGNQPNVRVSDVFSLSPLVLGNSLDDGALDPPLSYSFTPNRFSNVTIQPLFQVGPRVVELWDSVTGQGAINASNPNQAANWPPPSGCILITQPPINQPTACQATVMVETLAYGLAQPPVSGTPTYSVSPGSVTGSCSDASVPCELTITKSSGSGPATLTVTDVVTPPVGAVSAVRPRWTSPANVTLTCSAKVNFEFGSTGGPGCAGSTATLTVAVIGGGTVVGTGGTASNISCSNTGSSAAAESGTCTASYDTGSSATLTATPATGFLFQSWAGCSSGSFVCSLTVGGNVSIVATFKPVGTP